MFQNDPPQLESVVFQFMLTALVHVKLADRTVIALNSVNIPVIKKHNTNIGSISGDLIRNSCFKVRRPPLLAWRLLPALIIVNSPAIILLDDGNPFERTVSRSADRSGADGR